MTSPTPPRIHHQPVESPYPYSPLSSTTSNPNHGLSARHIAEIQTVFRIFDPNLNGYIDTSSFEIMTRSLGYRLTSVEVLREVDMEWEHRLSEGDGDEQQMAVERRIDLPIVISILAKRGYGRRLVNDEINMYFRLFDRDNKGFITFQDLLRVQAEIADSRDDLMGEMGSLDVLDVKSVGDAALKRMIEEFDVNRDGVIDLDEFCNVVQPILSSHNVL